LKVYQVIRDNGGFDNWKMVFIEKFPCSNRREAEAREEELRKELNGNLNAKKAFITEEQKKEYHKVHYENNKIEIKEYLKTHKEKIKEQKKEYYKNNKKIILEKQKQKYTCECGSCINMGEKLRHVRSQKHINFINNLEIKNI
jgi:hypothetical protein